MITTGTVAPAEQGYQGTERLLWGIVLAVVTFWLFAGTAGTVAPAILMEINSTQQYVDAASMNLAVSITALISGPAIVMMGGFADRIGRVKITLLGAAGVRHRFRSLAAAAGRSGHTGILSSVHPARVDGPGEVLLGRRRSAACRLDLVHGLMGWLGSGCPLRRGHDQVHPGRLARDLHRLDRDLSSVIAFVMILGMPQNKVEQAGPKGSIDIVGLLLFVVGTLGLMIVLLFGSKIGWTSVTVLGLAAVGIVAYAVFFLVERGRDAPFIDFKLFKNTTFTQCRPRSGSASRCGCLSLLMSCSGSAWRSMPLRPPMRPSPICRLRRQDHSPGATVRGVYWQCGP